ncbi:MAG: carboxypeptidase-like regulatory domain-containing protein [Candidatus Aminicenantales bacterium]
MKTRKKKLCLHLFTILFFFFLTQFVFGQRHQTGVILGHVYGLEKTRPVRGAVIKAKNVRDGTIYVSNPTDARGAFKIEGVKGGIYVVGVVTAHGFFNTDCLMGVYGGQTLKVAFSLNPYKKEVASAIQNVYQNILPSGECYVGEIVKYLNNPGEAAVYVEKGIIQVGDKIHIKGYVTDFFQEIEELYVDGMRVEKALVGQTPIVVTKHPVDVGDLIYVIPKRQGLSAFFIAPSGIASVVAASSAFAYGVVTLADEEPEKSSFKNKNKK